MDKEKVIEAKEMSKAMCLGCTQNECTPDFGCVVYNPARRAVEAGYGNVKQAVKEFAEKLKKKINTLSDMPRILFDSIIEECIKEHFCDD